MPSTILFDELSWPEINDAVERGTVILLPVGSTEQHGPHLPLDTDNLLAKTVCLRAAERAAGELLMMPVIPYGYNEHALDFPGTIHIRYDVFVAYCIDVCKSLAHAGFDRIVIVDGHGSNEHLCEFVARRATLETEAYVASTTWWSLAADVWEEIRESPTGGACHACELETSAYLHVAPERVQMEKAEDHFGGAAGAEGSSFLSVDLTRGWGPVKFVRWTSTGTESGISGAPSLATPEKGEKAIEAAATNLTQFCREFRALEYVARTDFRTVTEKHPATDCESVDGRPLG
jgi:creatinine amidohydrolase